MDVWIARDQDNALHLYKHKPSIQKGGPYIGGDYWKGGALSFDYLELPEHLFPEVTFENSPVEYNIPEKPCDMGELKRQNKLLRKLLWLRHGCSLEKLYTGDGEMRCSKCGIDFKMDHPEVILKKFISNVKGVKSDS